MKRFIAYFALASAAFLTGCASNDYAHYASAVKSQAAAEAMAKMYMYKAQEAKYQAMAKIAENGDNTAKALSSMAMGMERSGEATVVGQAMPQANYGLMRPESAGDTALKWVSALANPVTAIYGINRQARLGEIQSNNSTMVQMKQFDTMLGFGKLIPRSPVIVGTSEQQVLYPVVGDQNSVLVTPVQ